MAKWNDGFGDLWESCLLVLLYMIPLLGVVSAAYAVIWILFYHDTHP